MRRRQDIFVGFGNSKRRTPIGDYAEDKAKWTEIEKKTIDLINDENMMGVKWEKAARNRKAPTPKWEAPSPGPIIRPPTPPSFSMPGITIQ